MKPYYEDEAVTIYHGSVVECDAWTLTKERGGIGHGSAEKMCLSSSPARVTAISKPQSISTSARCGALSIPRGLAMRFRTRAVEAVRSAVLRILVHAGIVVLQKPNVTTSTKTPLITSLPISLFFVGDVTCRGMGA
jgi:hypothetical protein